MCKTICLEIEGLMCSSGPITAAVALGRAAGTAGTAGTGEVDTVAGLHFLQVAGQGSLLHENSNGRTATPTAAATA